MAYRSTIEWTQATWNPVTGCSKVSSGCQNCYAQRLAARLKAMGNPRYGNGFAVTLHSDLLRAPLHWREPRLIFVNSMSDLFHEQVPDSFIRLLFEVMWAAPWHVFQILTKRAERLSSLGGQLQWPPNAWVGVTTEDQRCADRRIPLLKHVPATVRFISCEPLLGPLDLNQHLKGLQWVITGGESGLGARPVEADWVRSIRDDCISMNIPFFFKQWGGRTPKSGGRMLDGKIWGSYPPVQKSKMPAQRVLGRLTGL